MPEERMRHYTVTRVWKDVEAPNEDAAKVISENLSTEDVTAVEELPQPRRGRSGQLYGNSGTF